MPDLDVLNCMYETNDGRDFCSNTRECRHTAFKQTEIFRTKIVVAVEME